MNKAKSLEGAVQNLIGACSEIESQILVAIRGADGSVRTLSNAGEMATHDVFGLAKQMLRSGDFDTFMRDTIKTAEREGHSSIYLRAMGVIESPRS